MFVLFYFIRTECYNFSIPQQGSLWPVSCPTGPEKAGGTWTKGRSIWKAGIFPGRSMQRTGFSPARSGPPKGRSAAGRSQQMDYPTGMYIFTVQSIRMMMKIFGRVTGNGDLSEWHQDRDRSGNRSSRVSP